METKTFSFEELKELFSLDKSTLMEVSDMMVGRLGADGLLEAVIRSMSEWDLNACLAFICRVYDIDFTEDEVKSLKRSTEFNKGWF